MEDSLKFVFYAIIFVIYIVSQVRKAKKKQQEEKASQAPSPVLEKPLRREASMNSSTRLKEDESFKKSRAGKPTLLKKVQARKYNTEAIEDKKTVYKSISSVSELEDEGTQVNRVLAERRQQEVAMSKDRVVLADEHLELLHPVKFKESDLLIWLKNKSNLKRAFVSSEVFSKKY